MAKFLNTSATNYFLEELIKGARDRVVLISPFLKLNDRIKELLADKNRLKIDVRMVYGKSELQPEEIAWLHTLTYVRTSFCKNLHAKCYLNESACIVTSLNLYEFSQVNNNEMGVLFQREEDPDLYRDAYEEALRIIRISEEVRISMERIQAAPDVEKAPVSSVQEAPVAKKPAPSPVPQENAPEEGSGKKMATSRIATCYKMRTAQFLEKMMARGFLELQGESYVLTAAGLDAGGELRHSKQYGSYFVWPDSMTPE